MKTVIIITSILVFIFIVYLSGDIHYSSADRTCYGQDWQKPITKDNPKSICFSHATVLWRMGEYPNMYDFRLSLGKNVDVR